MPRSSKHSESKAVTTASDWITANEGAQILCRDVQAIHKLVERGHIRVHRPPGLLPRFYRPDVEKFSPAHALAETA